MASHMMKMARTAVNRISLATTRQQCRQKTEHSWFTKYREPPNGFLFNQKPRKPGESITARWEDWEPVTYAGFTVLITTCAFCYLFKPHDTSGEAFYWSEAEKRVAENDAAEAKAKALVA